MSHMSHAVAWYLLLAGIGFGCIALQGAVRGQLPTQSNMVTRSRTVHRHAEPFAFWSNFSLYLAVGAVLCFVAIRTLIA